MTEHRDRTVADALHRLDVPEHAPGFWDHLTANLAEPSRDAEPSGDAGHASAPDVADAPDREVVALDEARTARRRGALPRWPLLVAAAAAVVALVVGVTAWRPGGDDESQLDSAGEVDDGRGADGDRRDDTDELRDLDARLQAEQTAAGWLAALQAGDVDEAHARLDAASRAALPLDELRQLASGLAEGAGAFAAERVDRDVLSLPEDPDTFVVLFHGEVEREGMVEMAAYPVVVTGVGAAPGIAFSLDGPSVELGDPTQGSTATSLVQVRVGATPAWLTVDGAQLRAVAESPATVDVEALAGAGTHVLTVVATDGELYTARSLTVVVP